MPDPIKLLTVQECLDRLRDKIVISERAFRQKVRESDCCRVHRNQIFLTEDDFTAFLETLKPWNRLSGDRRLNRITANIVVSGPRGGRTTSGRPKANSKDEKASEARRAIRALCAKRNATD
jgi:hypothetical protein